MKPIHKIWQHVLIGVFVTLGAGTGYYTMPSIWQAFRLQHAFVNRWYLNMLCGALIFFVLYLLLRPLFGRLLSAFSKKIENISLTNILLYTVGVILGLIIAWLINIPLAALDWPIISDVLPIILSIVLAYLGFLTIHQKGEDIRLFFRNLSATQRDVSEAVIERVKGESASTEESEPFEVMGSEHMQLMQPRDFKIHFKPFKVLDTSVIIDGRILDILKTGFIEGVIVIPHFVLKELQYIADSATSEKRVRGRRGLDILNDIQQLDNVTVEFYTGDFSEEEVDLKLIQLTKKLDGVLITNDFNLNKVSQIHQIKVLNINELTNALKTVVVPGDYLNVRIIKAGTEREQGVGYLSDGTMIVVEEGKHHIDRDVLVEVTSSIQTNAGKMIFGTIARV